MLDTKRLIAEVAARNGIRVDPDDPAFALVTLVQLVLEESSRQITDDMRASIADSNVPCRGSKRGPAESCGAG